MHPPHPVGAQLGGPRKLLVVAAIVGVQSLVSLAEVRAQPGTHDVKLGEQYELDVDMTVVAHCGCDDRSVRLTKGVDFELQFEAPSEDGQTYQQTFIIASGDRFVPPVTGRIIGYDVTNEQRVHKLPSGCSSFDKLYHHFLITQVTP